MTRQELLAKINAFPLLADELAEDLLSGDFRSVFKGQGIEFDEVRHYEEGDDIRSIDWNVSARFGRPFVKLYREERELTVCILLDTSASMASKYDQALLSAALLAFSAERTGQKVGALLFDQGVRRVIPPRKGRSHVMAMILEALDTRAGGKRSDLAVALQGARRLLKRRSLVVIVSDFLCVDWDRELALLAQKHDTVALRITEPLDTCMPSAGLLLFRDPETGLELQAPTGFRSFRNAWEQWHRDRSIAWRALCNRYGVAALELSTTDSATGKLISFFTKRRRR